MPYGKVRPIRTLVVVRPIRKNRHLLHFTDTVVVFVETISHDQMHADEVGERLETAGRNVTLYESHHAVSIETIEFVHASRINRVIDEPCIEQGDSPQRGAYPAAFCWFQWIEMNP
jgi:hypothetical protein